MIVNLFAGPGAGKSTLAAQVFALMKWDGINTELVTEFAKDLVWEKRWKAVINQFFVFGNQLQRLITLNVDVIITDSPILLSAIYDCSNSKYFKDMVVEIFNRCNNLNFFIERKAPYVNNGRYHDKDDALLLDNEIKKLLDKNDIGYTTVTGTSDSASLIFKKVREELKKCKTSTK